MLRFYRKELTDGSEDVEYCFNVEISAVLTDEEMANLMQILTTGFVTRALSRVSTYEDQDVVEIGPRVSVATAYSTNLVSVCRSCGLDKIMRIERSRRYVIPATTDRAYFIRTHHDRMTEMVYDEPLTTFDTGVVPEEVYTIPLIENGPDALCGIPGISMDEADRQFYYKHFVEEHGRNPTIVEIMDLNNANSEHSRHGFFKGKQIIDGEVKKETLFDLVTSTLVANPESSVIAFKDNSSVIEGYDIETIIPENPGFPSAFTHVQCTYLLLLTAETHNFPTGVAPFPGAETGTGGRIRDVQATGRGGFTIAGTAGYCVGNIHFPDHKVSGQYPCPSNLATALQIEIEASNGASDYGNKYGEPLIAGFTRSFDMMLESGERWGFIKPIMFTGGIGQMDARHTEKAEPEKGMLIVQVGGPAYRVGFGGGAASSMLQGENDAGLDFNAVQRGDAEMEQKMNRVIRACNEMGGKTIVEVIHDQGAGGPANVLKELVEKSGGKIEIRNIRVGDPTMSVLEIYVAEYQERNGFLIRPENREQFKAICEREKVGCEFLGEVTGDLRFIVNDAQDDSTPVDIALDKLLGGIPQKEFRDNSVDPKLVPLTIPESLTVWDALWTVLRLLSVGSKRFLTSKVDRSVTGLIAQQQCCGPLQLTVGDVAIVAQSHFGLTGMATAIGEQPIKMLVDPAAGARMSVGEALTNLVWASGVDLKKVKCSANWMWAPKLPGEGAAIYAAATAMRDVMIELGVAVDGGKDSLSMATIVEGKTVKSPRELVISVYAAIPDITRKVTPDIKRPGESVIFVIDPSMWKMRMGGSALAQALDQIGDESPDMDDPMLVKRMFHAVQELIDKDLILAGHDRSDGGIITTLLEMAFSGDCGLDVTMPGSGNALEMLFSEELGVVCECLQKDWKAVAEVLNSAGVPWAVIGDTIEERHIRISCNGDVVLDEEMRFLRQWWEETSHQFDRVQTNPVCAEQEYRNIVLCTAPQHVVPFTPCPTPTHIIKATEKPRVAILREEGSNGDREMTSAFYHAGFDVWDVMMTDLLEGKVKLDQFRGLVAVGGFSYADVPESAKGWAATIRCNTMLNKMFTDFYDRPDTFTLGVCNGCQLFALLGWVPWRGLSDEKQPRFVRNASGRFESRWSTVNIQSSPAIMLKGMEGSTLGVPIAHGEGRIYFPDPHIMYDVYNDDLIPIVYTDYEGSVDGEVSHSYPFNPNGSPMGIAGLCSPDGRHLAMMPHPERAFLLWQWQWMPERMKRKLKASPWLTMFQNAFDWCIKNTSI